jgi:ATP-dependent Clp protease ATP-binding subunit ClpA
MRELERRLTPEFRNRLDEVIVFAPLTPEEVTRIAQLQLDRLMTTSAARGKQLTVTPEALTALVKEGHSLAYGARFLKRVIDNRVKIPLSQIWGTADRFSVDVVNGEIVVTGTVDAESAEAGPFAGVA